MALQRCIFAACFLLLVVAVQHCHAGGNPNKRDVSFMKQLPDTVVFLNPTNYDELVFPQTGPVQSWLLIFYSSHSEICQQLIPDLVYEAIHSPVPYAKIGLINARHTALAERYHAVLPLGVYYTTGRSRNSSRIFPYDNAITYDAMLNFSIKLYNLSPSLVAEDVSDPAVFAEKVDQASLFVYRPSHSAGEEWRDIVDATLSLERARLFTINENSLPDWDSVSNEQYKVVVQTAQQCQKNPASVGPNGVILLSNSDRFLSPRCYEGLWLDEKKRTAALSLELRNFIRQSSYPSVGKADVLTNNITSAIRDSAFLGFIVVRGPLDSEENRNLVSVVKGLVQSVSEDNRRAAKTLAEEMSAPRIIWTITDSGADVEWLTSYKVNTTYLPEFVVVDVRRNRFYRTRKLMPKLTEAIRSFPWIEGGVEAQLLANFSRAVLQNEYWPEKGSWVGYIAEYISILPGLERVHRHVQYNDAVFVSGMVSLTVFLSLIFVALVTNGEWNRENWNKIVVQPKKNMSNATESKTAAEAKKKQ